MRRVSKVALGFVGVALVVAMTATAVIIPDTQAASSDVQVSFTIEDSTPPVDKLVTKIIDNGAGESDNTLVDDGTARIWFPVGSHKLAVAVEQDSGDPAWEIAVNLTAEDITRGYVDVMIPAASLPIENGDYKLRVSAFDASGTLIGTPNVQDITVAIEVAPLPPKTGIFGVDLTSMTSDYSILAIISLVAVVGFAILVARRQRRESK
jgi:hypothetical protein